jgi:hypothetical protein
MNLLQLLKLYQSFLDGTKLGRMKAYHEMVNLGVDPTIIEAILLCFNKKGQAISPHFVEDPTNYPYAETVESDGFVEGPGQDFYFGPEREKG